MVFSQLDNKDGDDLLTEEGLTLPHQVRFVQLQTNRDSRGSFTEFFREEWNEPVKPLQWSCLFSESNTLRGVKVHLKHTDYMVVVHGRAQVGLRDLRRNSPTHGLVSVFDVSADEALIALVIPPGVAHGFYSYDTSVIILGTSNYFDPVDELACHWADPALAIVWAGDSPIADRASGLTYSIPDLENLVTGSV